MMILDQVGKFDFRKDFVFPTCIQRGMAFCHTQVPHKSVNWTSGATNVAKRCGIRKAGIL